MATFGTRQTACAVAAAIVVAVVVVDTVVVVAVVIDVVVAATTVVDVVVAGIGQREASAKAANQSQFGKDLGVASSGMECPCCDHKALQRAQLVFFLLPLPRTPLSLAVASCIHCKSLQPCHMPRR